MMFKLVEIAPTELEAVISSLLTTTLITQKKKVNMKCDSVLDINR